MSPFGSIQPSKLPKPCAICLLRGMKEVSTEEHHVSWWLWCLLESSKGFQVNEWKNHCFQMLEVQCCSFQGGKFLVPVPFSQDHVQRFTSNSRHGLSILPSLTLQKASDTRFPKGGCCCLVLMCACSFVYGIVFLFICLCVVSLCACGCGVYVCTCVGTMLFGGTHTFVYLWRPKVDVGNFLHYSMR